MAARMIVVAAIGLGLIIGLHALAAAAIMVYAQAHWGALLNPVLLGVVCLVCVAIVWSLADPRLVHYPVLPLEPSPPSLYWGDGSAVS
jgi:hypothetical protein